MLSGLFRGQPVGGSVGQTALSVAAGARSRWAAIFAGIWMAVILVALSGLVGQVVMATLAAVLIAAAIGSLRKDTIFAILRTGRISQIALVSTLTATLVLPVATAVGLGLVISLLMQLNQEAVDLRLVELVPDGTGLAERPAPRTLESGRVILLDVYGSLFYAGARTLQSRLPDPSGSVRPVVVLRLRGRARSRHVVHRAGRLRPTTGCGRWSLLHQRDRPGRPRAARTQRDGRHHRSRRGVRRHRPDRRVEHGGAYDAAQAWLAEHP